MTQKNLPTAVCIMGPTACGKTDLAIELVERYPYEIISVDSAMVYRGLDIGTAKPDAQTLARAPHRLIDFLDPAQSYSAADFRTDALREMRDVVSQGKVPLLVGGTMLYFKSLLFGMAELPSADPAVREALLSEAEQEGWDKMHSKLAKVDPASAKRIHPNDPQRIQRALEVYQLTGIPLSAWQAKPTEPFPFHTVCVGIMPSDRAWLHQRISQRFEQMLEQGFEQEVRRLFERGDLDEDKPAIRAVGYRQMWQYLKSELSYTEMIERATAATRQLAKRQYTWLRSMPNLNILDNINNNLVNKVLNVLPTIHMME